MDVTRHDSAGDPVHSAAVTFLRQAPILQGFSEADIDALSKIARGPIRICAGETLFREGDPGDNIYFILSGEFEVLKREKGGEVQHRLAVLGAGKSIGEVSLLDNGPRSGEVRAITDGELLAVAVPELLEHLGKELSAANRMKINLAYEMAARLRSTNETTVQTLRERLEEAEHRAEMSKFISRVMIGLCLYMFALGVTAALSKMVDNTSWVSLPIILLSAIGVYRIVKTSPWPISEYGFTLKNWRSHAIEGLLLSIPAALPIILTKWLGILLLPSMADMPLFDLSASFNWTPEYTVLALTIYCLFTPVQEIIARSGIQSSLQKFFTTKHKTWEAIFLANLLFSVTHLHISLQVALLVFPLGIFWGWIFARQRSLVGCSVSHAILGIFSLNVVGFPH